MVVHIKGFTVVSLLALLLLAAVAVHAQGTDVMKDLDALKYRVNDLSSRMELGVAELQGAENTVNATHALSASDRVQVRSMAKKGVADADQWDGEITDLQKGLWEIQSRYEPSQMSRVNATIAEGKMNILTNDVQRLREMSADARILSDRIMRAA